MLEIKRILCPVDFSEFSARAYCRSLSIAQRYQAELFVQFVVDPLQPSYSGFMAADSYAEYVRHLLHRSKNQLLEFVKKYSDNKVQPQCIVEEGKVPDSILEFAEAQKTDVIVMGTHGRRGFDRLVLGSVTERVMRKAPCPVLIINKPLKDFTGSDKERYAIPLSRIIFCTDFSENSQLAFTYALSLSNRYNAELIVLHVLEDIPGSATTKKAIKTVTERLNRLIPSEGLKTGRYKTMVRIGKPYEQIIQLSQEAPTDIIIMAVCSRNIMDLAVFGSTTYRVILLGTCPVLAVHV